MQIKDLRDWNIGYQEKPLIIAGPCSAETEEQVLKTAHALKGQGVEIFRAGIWKPRTRPNAFEGVGSIGLSWMETVRKETGMLITTEVANVKHIYEVLKAGIDILWIGARTTANPFAMQEIADALKGVDIPVLVKNPVNPDVDLWQGAIERIHKAGIERIGAIHRGVSSFEETKYRNAPKWQMPIELKRRLPDLPMICDPSHIGGNRKLIHSISQKALDLNYDGLMIETHIDPDKAWTDAKQQVSPSDLKDLIQRLVLREVHPDGISYDPLEDMRTKIDLFDEQLMSILKDRMEVVHEIGAYKKKNKMTIFQPSRWDSLLKDHLKKGKKHKLSKKMINRIFTAIHQESIRQQTKIMNDPD
jgi:chorismate mutase